LTATGAGLSMQRVSDWLEKLGLVQYAQRFAENDISFSVLPDLTDQHLKELGVSLGHRLQLLRAIAELPSREKEAPKPVVATVASTVPQETAERRQVTVMFSDLVGSTALSTRMDPEDLREVISAYQKCVAETVQRLGGFVAKYMGDGVLIYFGYPQAHEDDAERAVRAGLELVATVGALTTHAPLRTRVGIATGLVVVGDLIGAGASQEQAIVGETPNLAARLQGIAEPNSVVIAESTRRLVGNLFEVDDRGTQDLKGIEMPVRAWAALRPSSVDSRFEALHAGALTKLVGREEELDVLLRRWSKAKSGQGQVVLLSGEAGIGKSRLTAALLEGIAAEAHTRLRYFCSPQHTDSALYPIINQMERAAGFTRDDNTQTKLDKLDALLSKSLTLPQDAALLADMLSLPNDGRYPTLELDPQQRRQKTLEALAAQLQALAKGKPVLMIFEDVHWTDPTSLETLGRTVDRLRTLGVLLIITYRPEFEAPWIGRPYVTALNLNRLGERDIAEMIGRVSGNKLLPDNVRQDIIERTDGIPLFVEEMTKAVLEAESESEARNTASAVPSSTLAVPASLHASLMARLDRLGPAKETAQVGAVIGRQFSHALLLAVAGKPELELQSLVGRLLTAGLLLRQGVPPHASYVFKHALVQDAAYGTLLREPRRSLHVRIAETLECQFAEIAESQPELLARHYTEAGLIEKAARLWGTAGQRSLARSALVEAAEQLTRALAQIETLPATPELRREQIKLQVALNTPLLWVKGPTAPESIAAAERGRLLIEQAEARGEPPDDPLIQFSALYAFWNAVPFNGDVCRGLAAQFLALAAKQQTTAPRLIGHRMMGHTLFHTGEFVEAKAHFDKGLALYNAAEHRPLATRFNVDSRIAILCYRSWASWVLGYPAAAISDSDQAVGDGRDVGQAGSLIYALWGASFTHTFCGNYATATALVNEVTAWAQEKGSLFTKAVGTLLQAEILALNGKATAALQSNIDGLNAFRPTGQTIFIPIYLSWLARTYAKVGNFDDAWRCIREAVTAIETRKETWCKAEVNRIAGEIALMSPEPDTAKAEAYFERALAVAREQQAKSWELRAATSLARLWHDQGKVQQARELLATVYGWFTEGFDTRDLKEAKGLLDELA
jgi:class 3 adenylate cyclase/predicted ATPase